MKLKKIGPLENAIGAIDDLIKELKEHRAELVAQLPPRKPPKPLGYIIDYRTGKKHYYGRSGE